MNAAKNMKKESLIVRITNRFKRWYWRWRNSDPIKNCPVYKNEGCSHVDGILCNFPNCSTYHEYMDHKWIFCLDCKLFHIDNCGNANKYGLGCYDGHKMQDNEQEGTN
jgi:hypothetical protein